MHQLNVVDLLFLWTQRAQKGVQTENRWRSLHVRNLLLKYRWNFLEVMYKYDNGQTTSSHKDLTNPNLLGIQTTMEHWVPVQSEIDGSPCWWVELLTASPCFMLHPSLIITPTVPQSLWRLLILRRKGWYQWHCHYWGTKKLFNPPNDASTPAVDENLWSPSWMKSFCVVGYITFSSSVVGNIPMMVDWNAILMGLSLTSPGFISKSGPNGLS